MTDPVYHPARKQLGKITNISFGFGGYQDSEFGLGLTFGGDGWGVSTWVGGWGIEPSDGAQWTVSDRDASWLKAAYKLRETLKAANKDSVEKLVGIPVECTFEEGVLKSWRVLTEVLP